MSTSRICHSLGKINLKSQLEKFHEDNKFSKKGEIEKAIELLTILVPVSDHLTTHRFKMHRTIINMLESYLDPFCQEYGIEIGIAYTLKNGAFGKTIITDWGDVFISIPSNTLSDLRTKLASVQKDSKTDFKINEYGSNFKVKNFISNFTDRDLSENESEKFAKPICKF